MARALTRAALLACLAWPVAAAAQRQDQAEAAKKETVKTEAAKTEPAKAELSRAVPVPPPVIASTTRSALEVATLISECAEDMSCPFLYEFKTKNDRAFAWLRAWCQARAGAEDRSPPETRVCGAATAVPAQVDARTREVTVFDLVEVAKVISPPTCSGFGLVVPLYSLRHVGGETVPSGPVKAGLGGGYYWGLTCRPSFSFGPEVFGYSEGLDPSGLMHVAVAAGLQLVAFKYFQFGLAVGYDVYRREAGSPSNGLLAGQGLGKASVSWLITFSVVPQETKQEAAK